MNLSAVWIRRPVLTIVVALIPAILGLFGIMQIQVRDLPQFDIPVIQVQTVLQGATPEEVAGRLTAPIERAIATVGNIDTLVSTSDDGVSSIQATFLFGTDSVVAANQVQAAIEQIADQLPSDALKPVISRLSLDNLPVIYLSLSSEKASPVEIGDVAHRLVVPQLTTIPGVGSVQIVGDREPIMKVTVNPFDLAAVKLDPSDVISGIRNHNVATPAGNVQGGGFTTGIEVAREVDPVKEVASAPVVEQGGQSLELRDIGSVDIVGDTSATSVTINGRPAVAIGVLRQSTANSLQLVAAIQKALPDIQAILPPGMKVGVAFDTTVSIRASLLEVRDTLVLAIVLVVGVVFAFLASFRSSLITLVTIPLSLLITVVFIWLVNFSFNTFTLLAFILAIGLVVDDAIVDVENVQRHIDLGLSPIDAAFVGSAEIGFAIVATTLTLASLYMPIALAPGMLGALFREFGLTLAVAVLASGVVSRTLSPMMCSRLLRPSRSSGYARLVDNLFESLTRHYRAVLRLLLGERMLIGFAAMSIIAVGIFAASTLQGEIAPNEDEGYILLRIDGPTGATAGYLESRSAAIERVFQTVPERLSSMIILGMPSTSQGYAFLVLKDWSHRKRRVPEITRSIMPAIEAIPGISTTNVPPNPLSGGQSQPIQIVIKATTGYRALMSVADRVLAQLAENPAVQSANVDLQYNLPRIQLTVDRALASDLGVSIDSIARTLQSLFGGFQVGRFPWQGNLYKIKLELPPDLESNPRTIGLVGVKTGGGDIVPLEALVDAKEVVGADFLPRFNQLPSVTISADPAPGYGTTQGLAAAQKVVEDNLEPGMAIDFAGQSRQLKQTNAANGLVFLLGIVFIFLTLAAQFESFRDPLIVLLVVPLSIFGALIALAFAGASINLYSGIGLLTLVGLIAKHGILITEFANQLRDRGLDPIEAVIEAAGRRLRAILMTTLAMVLGTVPLLLADASGAISRHDIGLVIVGGLLSGTLFSLFVVPAVYLLLTRRERKPLVNVSKEALAQIEDVNAVKS